MKTDCFHQKLSKKRPLVRYYDEVSPLKEGGAHATEAKTKMVVLHGTEAPH
jgi:hypothetical protein